MDKFLQDLLDNLNEQRQALREGITSAETLEERQELMDSLDQVDEQIRATETQLRSLPVEEPNNPSDDTNVHARGFNPLATFGQNGQMQQARANEVTDKFDTVEYRTAFMEYACRGVPIPANLTKRADAVTMTSDVGAVIPTTIMNEIVKELKVRGGIWAKVRKLNVQGGVEIPILSLKPKATWVAENKKADSQKLSANDKISFSYYGLECKVSQSLLANVTTLDIFQGQFVDLAVEAVIEAIEIGTFNGTGSGQMLGIINDSRVPAVNKITLSEAEFTDWQAWKKKIFGKIKLAYGAGSFYMAKSTFDGYIDGMVDKNGQPIGRVNYGIAEGSQLRFGGKTVEEVEDDIIKPFETASVGDVVAVFVNLNDYGVNSNLEMTMNKWTDNDTHEIKNNCLMILDGKLIDVNGVLIIKKGATAGA